MKMNKKAKQTISVSFIILIVSLIVLSPFLVFAQEPSVSILGDFGYSGIEISEIKITGDGVEEIKIEPGDKIEVGAKEIKFEDVTSFSQERVMSVKYIKQLINLSQFDDVGFTGLVSFSQKIKIDYPGVRWNGQEYFLDDYPITDPAIFDSWNDTETGRLRVPNIFMDDEYNKRINYKDVAEVGGHAIAYEKNGEYFIELIIEGIDYSILSGYIVDPKYYNDTDGFDILVAGASSPTGITTNGSDFWITDDNDAFVYHFNSTGDNQTDGFSTLGVAVNLRGITTNGSDFWVINDIDFTFTGFVYHFNSTGDNQTDGFAVLAAGAENIFGITTNGSDFWIADIHNDFIFHFNSTGDNQTDGFAGPMNTVGVTTNGSDFWVNDNGNRVIYHYNSTGDNQTDAFNYLETGADDTWGLTTNGSDFWMVDDEDNFVYHFSLDLQPPNVTIVSPLNQIYNTDSIDFNVTVIDYGVGMSTSGDGSEGSCLYSFDSGGTNYTMSTDLVNRTYFYDTNASMTQGSHTVTFYCNDSADNINGTETETFFIDSIYPQISITSPTNDTSTTNTTIDIEYTYTEINCDSVWWNDGDGANTTLASCGTNITTPTWSEGNHNVIIFMNDTANNINSTAVSFTIDTTNPQISIVSPLNNTNTSNIRLEIKYTYTEINCDSVWWNDGDRANTTLASCGTNITFQSLENQTDGFDVSAAGASSPFGIATNGSDFWVVDGAFVYHFNSTGDNQTDGFDVSGAGMATPLGITTNGSDFWVVDYTNNFVYHFNSTGDNQTDGFSTASAGATFSAGITTNGSDFWVADYTASFVFHFNSTGDNQTDGFYVGGVIDGALVEITTNGSDFWVVDTTPFVYHFNSTGDNQTDGFDVSAASDIYGIDTDNSEFWFVSLSDLFVYHYLKSEWSEGKHNVTIFMNDTANNVNSTTVFFTIDTIYPQINLVYPTNTSYNLVQTELNFSSSDINVGSCWYSTDGGITNTTHTTCANLTGLNSGQGSSTWLVGINDTAGNENYSTITFYVDSIKPSISLDSPINHQNLSSGTNVYVNFTSTDATGLDTCQLWHNNTGTWHKNHTWVGPSSGVMNFTTLDLSENTFIWNVWCNDTVNNYDWSLSNFTLTIDETNPLISLVYPTNTSYNTIQTELNFTYSDTHVGACWYSTDGGATNTTHTSCDNLTGLNSGQGSSTWLVGINDSAGNENYSSVVFFVDSIYPLISYEPETPADYANLSQSNIYVNVTWTETNLANITFSLYNSTGTLNSTTFTTATYEINWTNLSDSNNYTYEVNITDTLNNKNYTLIRNITLDTTNPIVNITTANNTQVEFLAITIDYNISDTYLKQCYFTLRTSEGVIHNYAENTSLSCSSTSRSISTLFYGTFVLQMWGEDYTGNLNHSNLTFITHHGGAGGGGGGGGTPITIEEEINITEKTFCGDGICQAEGNDLGIKEDWFNCNQDCEPFDFDAFIWSFSKYCFDNDTSTVCAFTQLFAVTPGMEREANITTFEDGKVCYLGVCEKLSMKTLVENCVDGDQLSPCFFNANIGFLVVFLGGATALVISFIKVRAPGKSQRKVNPYSYIVLRTKKFRRRR